jgi:hypothetical protein
LTHNISALLFTPFAALYVLCLLLRQPRRWRRVLCAAALAVFFGLMLSSWVWVPTLLETGLVQAETLTGDYFHHSRHFRAGDLVQGGLLFSYSLAPDSDTPFAMGLPQAVGALLGALTLVVRSSRRQAGRGKGLPSVGEGFVVAGLLFSTLMITPLSGFVWDNLPLLSMTQFPWRLLSVQALFTSAAVAALVPGKGQGAYVASSIAFVLMGSVLLPLCPDRLPVTAADVTVERLQTYELFTQNIGTTIRYEWLPSDAVPRPFTSDALVEPGETRAAIPLDGASLSATRLARGPTSQEWLVSGDGGCIAFPLLAWPGWGASIDGEAVEVWPVEGSGLVAVAVPSGEHRVALRLGRTPVRIVAELVSAAALIVAIVVAVAIRHQVDGRAFAGGMALVAVPALVFLSLPAATPGGEGTQTMDFDQMPFLHEAAGGIPFAEGPRLSSYAFLPSELAPGQLLTVRMNWTGVHGVFTATACLVSPAAIRHEVAPLAEASGRVSEGGTDVRLDLPADLARGVYLVEVRLRDAERELRALTDGGQERGTLFLRPVRVSRGPTLKPSESVLAAFGPAIRLHSAEVTPGRAKSRVAVRLAWSLKHRVASNYGISLRILDADDAVITALDTQPGYGYLPTGMWRPGELVTDSYVLQLPRGYPKGAEYSLLVILYQVSSGEVVGQASVGAFVLPRTDPILFRKAPRSFESPDVSRLSGVTFGEEIRLAGYDVEHRGRSVDVTLWWQALRAPADDYTVFLHLFDQSSGKLVAQSDAEPRGGAYPTSWWAPREIVSDTVSLAVAELPSAEYRLAVGLYDRNVTRLPAVADGDRVPDDRVILIETVEVR